MAFTIPASYPLIYLACRSDINLFFPSFTILIGAHYLPFVYGYRMLSFLMLASVLVLEGTICAILYANSFSEQAYVTGATLLLFATINYIIIKKEL